jgi:putative membrane protein
MDEGARHCAAMMEAMQGTHRTAEGGWAADGMMDMGGMGGTMLFGVLWLVLIAALAALVIFGAIWVWRRGQPPASLGAPAPRETLDRRYAAGELDRETYLQMRSDLEASR